MLAFGNVLRDVYLRRWWTRAAWTWHEAADVRVFQHLQGRGREGDLVWIGNWGDDERTAELHEYLLGPVKELGIRARVYGVRYPETAVGALRDAGIAYGGGVSNVRVPELFARFRMTVHVPRRPYVRALPGIPTIRVFEALACGIPLICSPWDDAEGLFTPGRDFLVARDGVEMSRLMRMLRHEPAAAAELAAHGRQTILARHTCGHRVEELLRIIAGSTASPACGSRTTPTGTGAATGTGGTNAWPTSPAPPAAGRSG